MKMVKVRETIAALVAVILVFGLLVMMSAVFGWNIPIISNVANMLGLNN
jgi:hypothetical protein